MKRLTEFSAEADTIKRRKQRQQQQLASLLNPCFQAVPRLPCKNLAPWRMPLYTGGRHPDDKLCCPLMAGPDGSLWYAWYQDNAREYVNISVMTLDGAHEVVAQHLVPRVTVLHPRKGELFFLYNWAICRVSPGSPMSTMVESNILFFTCYDQGILAVPRGQSHRVLERRDFSGTLLESIQLNFEVPIRLVALPDGDGLVYSQGTQVWRINLSSKCRYLLAGSSDEQGCQDGYGTSARFHNLKSPTNHDWNHVVIRDEQKDGTSRWRRINLTDRKSVV